MALDIATLQAALIGYQKQHADITAKMDEIQKRLGGKRTTKSLGAPARKKRNLSVAARKRIAEAQKKRWAAHRKAKAATA